MNRAIAKDEVMPLDADLIVRSLSLSEAERADLAHRLLVSLEPTASDSPQEVETAWAAELERRVDQLDRGEAKMIPWPDAEKRIRDALHKARRP
jgi:putative addiction module component (TIGR02574 family)